MRLTIQDRIMLLNGILPKEGSFTTLKQLRVLREELAISDEDKEAIELKQNFVCNCGNEVWGDVVGKCLLCGEMMSAGGNVVWDAEKDPKKDIRFPKELKRTIENTLDDLNNKEKLTEQHMSIYEKFCGEETEDEE